MLDTGRNVKARPSAARQRRARGLLGPASRGDVEACARLINGGVVGLDDRWMLYQAARHAVFETAMRGL